MRYAGESAAVDEAHRSAVDSETGGLLPSLYARSVLLCVVCYYLFLGQGEFELLYELVAHKLRPLGYELFPCETISHLGYLVDAPPAELHVLLKHLGLQVSRELHAAHVYLKQRDQSCQLIGEVMVRECEGNNFYLDQVTEVAVNFVRGVLIRNLLHHGSE